MDGLLNALSFDVEDYFQVAVFRKRIARGEWEGFERRVRPNVEKILEILKGEGVRATFFTLGWIAERDPALVRAIAASGHEIASHGYGHCRIMEQSPSEFRDDVRRAKAILEDVTGAPVRGYRAPSFSVTKETLWALDVLLEEGYDYDSSIFPWRHPDYGIPEADRAIHRVSTPEGRSILEFPMSVAKGPFFFRSLPVSGGGYFRLLPLAVTRWGLRRINREGRPVVFYLHPWELDPAQPDLRRRASRLGAFRHYVNLKRTEPRLRSLLRTLRFTTLSDVLARNEDPPVRSYGPMSASAAPGR